MNKLFCPECNRFCETRNELRQESIPVKGEETTVECRVAVCETCGTDLFDEDLESVNLDTAYRKYREKHCLLTPSQITELRERYGLSQRAFSRLLGWGDITLHRYESGAVQDKAHNTQLVMIQDSRNLRLLLETNGDVLPISSQRSLANRISNMITEDAEPRFNEFLQDLFSKEADVFSGFRRFDVERFQETILYFCQSYSEVFKTKLLKSLWYADFLSYKENALSITGSRYLHWALGPVPDSYELLLGYMAKSQMVNVEIVPCRDGNPGEMYLGNAEPDLTIFSDSEIAVLEFVSDKCRDLSGEKLWKMTHDEAAYKETEDRALIPYSYAEKLSMSLNQN